jgi:nucleoside-diphosphate-sugar epimerase
VDENHALRPLNAYALSKIANETAGRYFSSRTAMSVLSFRIMGARAQHEMEREIEQTRKAPAQGRFLLWTRIDARDVADACVRAATITNAPSGEYNITGDETLIERDTEAVLGEYCSSTPRDIRLTGWQSPMSCRKAHDAFGFSIGHPVLCRKP